MKKDINKKAFTLIELLAVIVILGVLLVIAVPSISRYITNSKKDTYEKNLAKLVDAVVTEANSHQSGVYNFASDEYLIIPLSSIELERGDSSKSPFGRYGDTNSFIIVTRKNNDENEQEGFNYYVVSLDSKGFGTNISLQGGVNIVENPEETTFVLDTETSVQAGKSYYKLAGNIDSQLSLDIASKKGKLVENFSINQAETLNIKVGDYVEYKPLHGTYKVVSGDNGTGTVEEVCNSGTTCDCTACSDNPTCSGEDDCPECCECNPNYVCPGIGDQEFETVDDLRYRVFDVNSDGSIELIPVLGDLSKTEKLYLRGPAGFNNAVNIMDDLAKALYSNKSIGAVARSLDLEDIESKSKFPYYNIDIETNELGNKYNHSTRTPTNLTSGVSYPAVWLLDSALEQGRSSMGYSTSTIVDDYYTYKINVNGVTSSAIEKPSDQIFYIELQPKQNVLGASGTVDEGQPSARWRYVVEKYLYNYDTLTYYNRVGEDYKTLRDLFRSDPQSNVFWLATRVYEMDDKNVLKDVTCNKLKPICNTGVSKCDENTPPEQIKYYICAGTETCVGTTANGKCFTKFDENCYCFCLKYDENGICVDFADSGCTKLDGDGNCIENTSTVCPRYDKNGICIACIRQNDIRWDTKFPCLREYIEFPHIYLMRGDSKVYGLSLYNTKYEAQRCFGNYVIPIITIPSYVQLVSGGTTTTSGIEYNKFGIKM